jgi:hypothetical protein
VPFLRPRAPVGSLGSSPSSQMSTAIGVRRVGVCVHSTRPGTHPLPGGRSARPSICARSSSRKRAQSARRSSETNSPGSSDSPAGAFSGCCSGSRNHSPLSVETVGNSCVCVNRRSCALRALKRRRRGATLSGRARSANPPNVRADLDLQGGKVELRVHEDSLQAGRGAWPLRLAKRLRSVGRAAAAPALAIVRRRQTRIKQPNDPWRPGRAPPNQLRVGSEPAQAGASSPGLSPA